MVGENTLIHGRRRKTRSLASNVELTLLALPAILFVFVFNYIPLYGLVLPFKEYKYNLGILNSPWIGLKNFEFLLTSKQLWTITRNTVGMNFLFITISTLVSIIFALMLYELTSKKLIKAYQTIMFFPYFISWVVAAYIFMGFLDADTGIANRLLGMLGVQPQLWYSMPKFWPYILTIGYLWKFTGQGMLIYYASLMSVDHEYFEAATLDGATRLQKAIYISIPSMLPLIVMLTVLSIGKIFYSDFGLFYNVPLNQTQLYSVTDVIDTYVFRTVSSLGDLGMSSAAGLYQSLVGFILVLLTNFIVTRIDKDYRLF